MLSWAQTGGGGDSFGETRKSSNRSLQPWAVARSYQTSRFSRPHVRPPTSEIRCIPAVRMSTGDRTEEEGR